MIYTLNIYVVKRLTLSGGFIMDIKTAIKILENI